jgi:acyl transferase domain-containing protein/acyl carrier protein
MRARKSDKDPIAIVGIACRFPGNANDPDSFWRLLCDGTDAIREIPPDRWNISSYYDETPGAPGRTNSRWGGFIDGIDRFDAGFFGISPREAALMDPQQRVLMEVAAEAIEDAGLPADRISGTESGVFVGISSYDYAAIQQTAGEVTTIDTHSNTGAAFSIVANRISYFFDLRGTSVALDTACSSALVAVHFACQSIWRGEATLALACGVNVLIKPEPFLGFSRLSMLSADGRCKAFDKSGDGFVRGEGAGVVVLKPLSEAKRDGDRIYAAILATASNQDGRTSSMVVPSVEAQAELLRQACREAGISPHDVQYVEAHGTGTPVGDPIEARALGKALCEGRAPGNACIIGSVKTNIGHLEPASGIAGLIKTALALEHRSIPASLHFQEAPPDIPLDELNLRIARDLQPWPNGPGPALAGVNSFGFGGANAHAVLAEVPPEPSPAPAPASTSERLRLFPLSARSEAALVAAARGLHDHLQRDADRASLDDLCYSLSTRRTHYEHRLAVISRSREELADSLRAFADGESRPSLVSGRIPSDRKESRCVFVCSGQGPQWWAMGRQLLEAEPVFRETILECDERLSAYSSWSLWKELNADEASSRMQETSIAQPALFSIQVGLARLWRSWGIVPDAVIGHSVGEVACAYLAGALDLEDALRVIFERGRSMDVAGARGRMLAVGLSQEEARGLVVGLEDRVSVAAINTPASVTLSGDSEALEKIERELEGRNVFAKFLRVNYAFHSPQMDPTRAVLLRSLEGIRPRKVLLPMISSVTAAPVRGEELDADYWWLNVRKPVLFSAGIDALLAEGYDHFLELSPHPVLSGAVLECAQSRKKSVTAVSSLRRDEDERFALLRSLAVLHTLGRPVDWNRVSPRGRFVRLPKYPWQHESYWVESEVSRRHRLADRGHALLGSRMSRAEPTWESRIDSRLLRFLGDHRVQGQAVLPATSYLEMAVAAALELHGRGAQVVENVEFSRACFLEDDAVTTLQFSVDAKGGFRIHRKPEDSAQPWLQLASGGLRAVSDSSARPIDLSAIRARLRNELEGETCYRRLHEAGLEYGDAFRGIERLWAGEGEALAAIRAPEALGRYMSGYHLHPALLDACLQALFFAVRDANEPLESHRLFLPVSLRQIRVQPSATRIAWSHVRLVEGGSRSVEADIQALDEQGNVIAELKGLRCTAVDGAGADRLEGLLYHYIWLRSPLAGSDGIRASAPAPMPSPRQIADSIRASGERIDATLELHRNNLDMEAKTDALSTAFILNALRELGFAFQVGKRVSLDALIADLDISPRRRRSLGRLFEILAEDGFVERRADTEWEVLRAPKSIELVTASREFLEALPAYYGEWSLLESCGRNLAGVLRGEVDPLEVIFPEGSLDQTEQFYRDSPFVRYRNMMAAKAVTAVAAELPASRLLRIVEIGAGTGGLTSSLVRALPSGRAAYTFTDVSKHFLVQAQEKFRDYPFLSYEILDIEREPSQQGFEPHSFDIVVAVDVLHATADLRQTIAHVRELLSPHGLLLLAEAVRPMRWVDLVFGLTDGWWRFTDRDLRPSHPLLSSAGWQRTLGEEGFSEVTSVFHPGGDRAHGSVFLARAPRGADQEAVVVEPAPVQEREAATWLIMADRDGIAARLAERLRRRGQNCVTIFCGDHLRKIDDAHYEVPPDDVEPIGRVVREVLAATPACRGVIHLWSADLPSMDEVSTESIDRARRVGCLSVLRLAQVLGEADPAIVPRLWLVTRHAEAVSEDDGATSATQAPLWGLGRVMTNEFPKLRPTLIDLGESPDDAELDALCAELFAVDGEDEVALRGDIRYVHRFLHDSPRDHSVRVLTGEPHPTPSFRLETPGTGVLDQLTLRAAEPILPGPGQIEIEVAAAGLNFSDVMKSLGIYPGLPDGPIPLGIECAGRVSATGPDVEEFKAGDEVIAIAPFSFGSRTLTSAQLVARKPSGLRLEEAATIPVAFLTAHYALNHLGHLAPGERVLIQSASGGVGLAAIQLARSAGAEIYATAGTPRKRRLLQALGIEHVMDSRSLDFADQIMEATRGEGVDVVLNSLAGSGIDGGLAVLRDHGRFLEIGKRDIYQDSRLGLRAFRKNLSFMAIDLDRALRTNRSLFRSLLRDVVERFDRGHLRPLPHRVFSIADVVDAFRTMAKAKHIGKVILSLQEQDLWVAPPADGRTSFRRDATYLVTGGLGGFGLAVAQWMIDQGARHLVLMGRAGARSREAQEAVLALRQSGAEVKVVTADASKWDEVAAVLGEIDRIMPPLRGVFHAAMVLEDTLLLNMNDEQLAAAWAPKVHGAFNLHAQTKDLPLDCFVLFSSMASIFGSIGQGNYASANRFLESLAYYRRARGLPALAVSWGYLGEVGFVARHPEVGERFEAAGMKSFNPREALTVLGRLLQRKATHAAVVRADWERFRRLTGDSPRFQRLVEGLREGEGASSKGADGVALRNALSTLAGQERRDLLESALRHQVARVLGASPEKIDLKTKMTDLGFDSLMAVELRNWVENTLQLSLPTTELLRGPSVSQLAERLLEQIEGSAQGSPAVEPAAKIAETSEVRDYAEEIVDQVDMLSNEEVDKLLLEMEEEREPGRDRA